MVEEDPTPEPTEPEAPSAEQPIRVSLDAAEYKLLKERHLRAAADLQNFQKRVSRERQNWTRDALQGLLKELLPILDNFDRALQTASDGQNIEGVCEGLRLVESEMLRVLKNQGVESIEAVGKPFDATVHEAVAQIPTEDQPDGVVLEVVSRGYTFKGFPILPARVMVTKRPDGD